MKCDFDRATIQVKRLHGELMRMAPVTRDDLGDCDFAGVYLFIEAGKHLYVGRTRRLKKRILEHSRQSVKDAPLAFWLAREVSGKPKPSYKPQGSRDELLADPAFAADFAKQKERIAKMFIRYVRADDSTTQALLEIYTSTVLDTRYNDFKTT